MPVTSQIIMRSVGSVEMFSIMYTVPAMPMHGNNGPHGTLKERGDFGRR